MTQQQTDDADVPMGGTQDEEGSVGGKCVQRRAWQSRTCGGNFRNCFCS